MEPKLTGIKIAVLGGDQRELQMLKMLADTGAEIMTLGQPEIEVSGIKSKDDLSQVVKGAEVIIGPMVSTDEAGFLKATFVDTPVKLEEEFFAGLDSDTLFLLGIARGDLPVYCQENDIQLIELAKLDEVAVLNAIPTAEGAIQIAMQESDITLHSNKSMVIGLGRVGLTQARMLTNLGSQTYGVDVDPAKRARAKEIGIKPIKFSALTEVISKMDFIFNTVPALVLDEKVLTEMKSEALIIDLASAPGGIDFETAEELGIKALLSSGLPGKVAPKSAGRILGEVIPRLITEKF